MPQKKVRSQDINATGTPDGTTFLRGDNTWSAPASVTGTPNQVDVTSGVVSLPSSIIFNSADTTLTIGADTRPASSSPYTLDIHGASGTTTGSGGDGGFVTIYGGTSSGDGTVNRNGGPIVISGGLSYIATGDGGSADLRGGPAATGGNGGSASVIGGSGENGGDVKIILGTGSTAAKNGRFQILTTAGEILRATPDRRISNTGSNATANLDLKAGTATTGTAPLKIAAGTNLTTPESGAIETNGTHLYWTDSGAVRRQLDQQATARTSFTSTVSVTSGTITPSTNQGYYSIVKDLCTFEFRLSATTTGSPTEVRFTLPITGAGGNTYRSFSVTDFQSLLGINAFTYADNTVVRVAKQSGGAFATTVDLAVSGSYYIS